ncbi:MAG: AEC family transporter [Fimbriimonadaceae bacterium]|nr:AEC family transporter [Alphaproteobacteria bacterium]
MADLLSLAFPFFSLIFLGFGAGKIRRDISELGWLQTFVIYLALPALFFQLVSKTPIEELVNWRFILTTTFVTYCTFVLAFVVGVISTRGAVREATIQGVAGSYANVGYLGPGLTIGALGASATVPTALIFTFDSMFFFTIVPLMMSLSAADPAQSGLGRVGLTVLRKVCLHPFILATVLGVLAAYLQLTLPQPIENLIAILAKAAAPCALFAMGVTVAQRPLGKFPLELPFLVAIKLLIHPLIMVAVMIGIGGFDPIWMSTAILMASLPSAANAYVMAQEYGVYAERASAVILVTTLLSVLTVSAILYLVTNNLIPLAN